MPEDEKQTLWGLPIVISDKVPNPPGFAIMGPLPEVLKFKVPIKDVLPLEIVCNAASCLTGVTATTEQTAVDFFADHAAHGGLSVHQLTCFECKQNGIAKPVPAFGYYPLPNGVKHLCAMHWEAFRLKCFYVLKLEEEPGEVASDFDSLTWAKHKQLRGSRDLKVFTRRDDSG